MSIKGYFPDLLVRLSGDPKALRIKNVTAQRTLNLNDFAEQE